MATFKAGQQVHLAIGLQGKILRKVRGKPLYVVEFVRADGKPFEQTVHETRLITSADAGHCQNNAPYHY